MLMDFWKSELEYARLPGNQVPQTLTDLGDLRKLGFKPQQKRNPGRPRSNRGEAPQAAQDGFAGDPWKRAPIYQVVEDGLAFLNSHLWSKFLTAKHKTVYLDCVSRGTYRRMLQVAMQDARPHITKDFAELERAWQTFCGGVEAEFQHDLKGSPYVA